MPELSSRFAPNCPTIHEHALQLNAAYTMINLQTGVGFRALQIEADSRRLVETTMDSLAGLPPEAGSTDALILDAAQNNADHMASVRHSSVNIIDLMRSQETLQFAAIERHTALHEQYGGCEIPMPDIPLPEFHSPAQRLGRLAAKWLFGQK